MNKYLKRCLIANTAVYWSVYLCKSFIVWELRNPFQWIIDLPEYNQDVRFSILFFVLFIVSIEGFIINSLSKQSNHDTNPSN